MVDTSPALAVDPRAGKRETFHRETRAVDLARERFEILQPIELAGRKASRRRRRAHDDFDDGRRQAHDALDGGAQFRR